MREREGYEGAKENKLLLNDQLGDRVADDEDEDADDKRMIKG